MACDCTNCNICNHFIKSSSIAITGSGANQKLTITIPPTIFTNLDEYCLAICQTIPTGAGTLPIIISNNGTSYTTVCRKGNILRADQLRTRRKYKITFGNDSPHVLFMSNVCPTSYVVTVSEDTKPTEDTKVNGK